jgi:integrase
VVGRLGPHGWFEIPIRALKIAALTFVRPGELRHATWAEFNLDAAEWRISGERMKMREHHVVPLSRQAVELLRELQAISRRSEFLFPAVGIPAGR